MSLRLKQLVAILLCVTMMFKVMVPLGYMPDFEAMRHGVYRIALCKGTSHESVLMTKQGTPLQDHHQQPDAPGDDGICPFAGVNGLLLLAVAIVLALQKLRWRYRFHPLPRWEQFPTYGLAWPRAPPASV